MNLMYLSKSTIQFLITFILFFYISACKSTYDMPTPGDTKVEYGGEDIDLEPRDGQILEGKYNGKTMIFDKLDSVYFSFDSYSVENSQRPKIQEAADYIKNNPKLEILIEGHCDWHGTEDYNLSLGELRANSVAEYMNDLGIDPNKISIRSLGSLEATIGLSKSNAANDRVAKLILLQ